MIFVHVRQTNEKSVPNNCEMSRLSFFFDVLMAGNDSLIFEPNLDYLYVLLMPTLSRCTDLNCNIITLHKVEPDGCSRVGRAGQVRHVDSLKQTHLRRVSVQIELQYGRVAECYQSNTTDSWTVSDAVNVQRLDNQTDELSHALKVVEPDASRPVQRKHHVGTVRTSYKHNTHRRLDFCL